MVAASRNIEKEWSEFESYSTNLYAQTAVTGDASTAAALVPSAAREDSSSAALEALNMSQLPTSLDIKAISDEMTAMKKAVGDLRVYAEEVREQLDPWHSNRTRTVEIVDESMYAMDDGRHGASENVQRTETETTLGDHHQW